MNSKLAFLILAFFSFAYIQTNAQQPVFDKSNYYKVLESGSINEINAQLSILKASAITEKDAYEGALLMKKAGQLKKAKDKMSVFKEGRSQLESSISKASNNTEYRFLRLIIQENAPKQVKYHNDIEKDCKMIRSNFKTLSPLLQGTIVDYSKKSKVLTSL